MKGTVIWCTSYMRVLYLWRANEKSSKIRLEMGVSAARAADDEIVHPKCCSDWSGKPITSAACY